MLTSSPTGIGQLSFFDIADQLDPTHSLLALANRLDFDGLEEALKCYYSDKGRAAKPIRLMSGLLMLKQLYNLSDEAIVEQWSMNPYFQVFCGETRFQASVPCHPTELVKFRNRIGQEGIHKIFALSVRLHGNAVEERTVLVDTTVQEKAITYPTDSKLAIKIINRLNKLAKEEGIKQRRTYVKEVKHLRLACRHFRHVKLRRKAKKAVKRLRTIVGILKRELQRTLPQSVLVEQDANFALYERVINQKLKDKNKVYSLHESGVYCVAKGKDHKAYEYGSKASIVSTLKSQVIVAAVSHDKNEHDSKTLSLALSEAQKVRNKPIELAVVDRGYRGSQNKVACKVLLPGKPLKRDTPYQKRKKRDLCRKRAAIEPIIGHLKSDYRLSRNWLKGTHGDAINVLMAACAWNLKKWMIAFFVFKIGDDIEQIILVLKLEREISIVIWSKV